MERQEKLDRPFRHKRPTLSFLNAMAHEMKVAQGMDWTLESFQEDASEP